MIVISDEDEGERQLAEAAIFGTGRPMIVLPGDSKLIEPPGFDTVVLAWDSSRAATRALHDALPILEQAKTTRMVTVERKRSEGATRLDDQLKRHLSRHEIEYAWDIIEPRGQSTGEALQAYAATHNADLLVMGAFGHSRLRDFILGGVTQHMLRRRPLPILLSH